MTQDRSKKTLRQFQCRDYLWDNFARMSSELECSTDYLINEAMRHYAKSRSNELSSPLTFPSGGNTPLPTWDRNPPAMPPSPPSADALSSSNASSNHSPAAPRRVPPPTPPLPSMRNAQPSPMPPPSFNELNIGASLSASPAYQTPAGAAAPSPSYAGPPPTPSTVPPMPIASSNPPLPPSSTAAQSEQPTLFLWFQGKRLPITKSEYIIGRGTTAIDLSIPDGNISRRHAAVIYHQGAYYIRDLGSTNGVDYQGQRTDIKRIDEGDVFLICDYELRFTYR